MNGRPHYWRVKLLILSTIILIFLATIAGAQSSPVSVTFTVTGDPVPGEVVTAKTAVTIHDGSTLQSIVWRQTGGIDVVLSGQTTDTVTITLPARKVLKDHLIEVLEEPPHVTRALPGNVPVPQPYYGGLQDDRFGVVGASLFALEEAGAVDLNVSVTTSSGTYDVKTAVHANLPWTNASGIRNVPVGVPVLLHGKEQESYDWSLNRPAGSAAVLIDGETQSPEFVPDITGTYVLTVTDQEAGRSASIEITAGTWMGVITGQDSDGRPTVDAACTVCHQPDTLIDQFSEWRMSGHAEILTDNVNNPSGHYSTNCIGCHAVGYDPAANNGGIDDMADWPDVVASGILSHGAETNWETLLSDYPQSARMMNIQCENCHGPQGGSAHRDASQSRTSLSSDVCASCHGEPARHGRFQQWQLSGHANYQLAREEGTSGSCAGCHSAQGFLAWQQQDFTGSVKVTWTEEEVHPQTCATCHDPHSVGTTSGGPQTNATVRVQGSTPMLMSGYVASDVGRAAICMTCHNGRRGLRDDDHFNAADAARAPHAGPQTDVLMGRNLFFTEVGKPGYHAMVEDSCVTCHMEETKPPADFSYNSGGTNHVFYASNDICEKCHTEIDAAAIQGAVETKMDTLADEIESAILAGMKAQLRTGNSIDIGGTIVTSGTEILSVEFGESHGRQAISVNLSTGEELDHVALSSVKVVPPAGSARELYATLDSAIAKAGWNYLTIESDGSHGAHNTSFVNSALDVSIFATRTVTMTLENQNPNLGGGPGNGAGAVSCTTPFVYWAEIAGHLPGTAGSQWRTDLVARNLSGGDATLGFYLHEANRRLEGSGMIEGASQMVFEDIVGLMGGTNDIGSLEICSDRPLLVMARIFNLGKDGTFGQSFDGRVADLGYGKGETISLIGLRQQSGAYRTNLSVTNGGTTEAEVSLTLYDASGGSLATYTLTIPPGQVVQETGPFVTRANKPDVGWGFATVTVLEGENIQSSASMVDMKTNDPTTIPAKQ